MPYAVCCMLYAVACDSTLLQLLPPPPPHQYPRSDSLTLTLESLRSSSLTYRIGHLTRCELAQHLTFDRWDRVATTPKLAQRPLVHWHSLPTCCDPRLESPSRRLTSDNCPLHGSRLMAHAHPLLETLRPVRPVSPEPSLRLSDHSSPLRLLPRFTLPTAHCPLSAGRTTPTRSPRSRPATADLG